MATGPVLSPRLQLTRALRERFLAEAGKALLEISGAVQERLTTLVDELTNARDAQLRRDFPAYFDLVNPTPLSIARVQALLGDGDALLLRPRPRLRERLGFDRGTAVLDGHTLSPLTPGW